MSYTLSPGKPLKNVPIRYQEHVRGQQLISLLATANGEGGMNSPTGSFFWFGQNTHMACLEGKWCSTHLFQHQGSDFPSLLPLCKEALQELL